MDCPICETSNISESNNCCPTCGYDISPYPLVIGGIPQPFIDKEQQRIAWAKRLWADCQAKIAEGKAASIQSRDQFNQQFNQQLNQIVSQVEQLTQAQTQLSKQLAELVSANMSARFSEIEQGLKQGLKQELEGIAASQLADLSATLEQQIIDRLTESLSEEISTAVSPLKQRLDSLVTVSPPPESTTSATPQPSAPDTGIPLQTFSFITVKVSDRGNIVNREDHQVEYFTEDLGNGVTLDMVAIPGGTFIMGSLEQNQRPQHPVTVPAFFMAKYLVTQHQWQAVMGINPSDFKGASRPVENVRWNDAVEFCQRLSDKTGRDYRLPSEAEWEYACRAGTTTPFYFGETITTDLANYANYYGSNQTTDVGIFPTNGFGLYDMHGNLQEWCADHWHGDYDGAPTDGSAWISGGDSNKRLLRGGYWNFLPRNCRSAYRSNDCPGYRDHYIGFRIVVSLPRTL